MDKELKRHLNSLTDSQRSRLEKNGQVLSWAGLTDEEAAERLALIDKKFSDNEEFSQEDQDRLDKIISKISS